jgi:predicted nucleic acid-binding protein
VIFIATALSLKGSVVWSEDKGFEKQNKIGILKTKDMIKMFS